MNFLNYYEVIEVIELWTYSVSDEVTEHEREEREQTWCFYQWTMKYEILIELLWTLWTIMKLLKLLNYDEVIEVIELWTYNYWSYWTMMNLLNLVNYDELHELWTMNCYELKLWYGELLWGIQSVVFVFVCACHERVTTIKSYKRLHSFVQCEEMSGELLMQCCDRL